MRSLTLSLLSVVMLAGTALSADGWARYLNPRYGYGLDIPPGFSPISESDNSDGGTSHSADGQAELAVWGANLLDDTLPSDVESRIHSTEDDGWQITYSKLTDKWASWSGEREGRIFYARAIQLCHDDQAGYFQLEYPASQRPTFDPLVERLVKGFKHTICE